MAKIDITRTELVWPGKYNEDGIRKEVSRVRLPFQVIETINESRATREAAKTKSLGLFDVYEGKEGDTSDEGWKKVPFPLARQSNHDRHRNCGQEYSAKERKARAAAAPEVSGRRPRRLRGNLGERRGRRGLPAPPRRRPQRSARWAGRLGRGR